MADEDLTGADHDLERCLRSLACEHLHVTPREGAYCGRCLACDTAVNVAHDFQHWQGPTWTAIRDFLRAAAAHLPPDLARQAQHLGAKLDRVEVPTLGEEAQIAAARAA